MNRIVIAGGTYAEAHPDGRWCAQVAPYAPIQTSWGDVPAPERGLITVRLDPVPGSHRLCGHEQADRVGTHVVLFDGATWHRIAPTDAGGDASAFGPTGRLYWVPNWHTVQSLEGPLITGHEVAAGGLRHVLTGPGGQDVSHSIQATYADPGRRIWGYTEIGDVTVGQGSPHDVVILHGGRRHRLDTNFCWYVRFNRVGEQLAIAYWKAGPSGDPGKDDRCAVLVWLTVAELERVPLDVPAPIDLPPPPPPPSPDPEPEPEPEPMPAPVSLESAIREARARYDERMVSDQCVELLNRVLWEAPDKGWRLFAKKPGQAGGTRYDGTRVSHDFLIHTSGWCVDCFGSAGGDPPGGPTTPQWGPRLQVHADDEDNRDRWVVPIPPMDIFDDPPPPPNTGDGPPVGTPLDPFPIMKVLDTIVGEVGAQAVAMSGMRQILVEMKARLDGISDKVDAIKPGTFTPPHYAGTGTVRILGMPTTITFALKPQPPQP